MVEITPLTTNTECVEVPAPGRVSGNTRECLVSFCFVIFFMFTYKVVGSILLIHMCFWLCSLSVSDSLVCLLSPAASLPSQSPFCFPIPCIPFHFPPPLRSLPFWAGWGKGSSVYKDLPCMQKVLSSTRRTYIKRLGVVVHTYGPSPGEAESSRSLGLRGQPA